MIKIMITLWLMMVCLTTNIYGFSPGRISTPAEPVTPPLPPHCVYEGEIYEPGPFKPDPCTWCECGTEGEEAMCYMQGCAAPPCEDYLVPTGECCPVCPNGPN